MFFFCPQPTHLSNIFNPRRGKKKSQSTSKCEISRKAGNRKCSKNCNREYLRPTPVFPASPTQAPLLLDIIATQVCIRVSHLLVIVVRTLYDTVDCLTPSAVASRPVPQIGIGFNFRLQPKKVTLRRRGEFEDEDTAGCARSVRGKGCFRGEDDQIILWLKSGAGLPTEVEEL